MPRSPLPAARLSHASALLAHVEPALRGARVLVIGDSQTTLAVDALGRGATLVRVLDPVSARAEESARLIEDSRVEVVALGERALRQGRYDCVVVENLGGIPRAHDLVPLIPNLLTPAGIAVVATASEEETSGFLGSASGKVGYDLFNQWVEENFESSFVLAATPFLGVAVIDLGAEGVVAPSLDNGFLHGAADRVDHYVAIAGSADAIARLRLATMSIVQFEAKRALSSDSEPTKPPAEDRESAEKLRSLTTRLSDVTAELEREKSRSNERAAEIERLRASGEGARRAEEELERVRAALDAAERRIADFEKYAERFESEKAEIFRARKLVEDEVVHLRERVPALEKKVAEQEDELYDLDDALADAEKSAEEAKKKLAELEVNLGEAHAKVAMLEATLAKRDESLAERDARLSSLERELVTRAATPTDDEDVARLEAALVERGRKVAELEATLEETAAFARTLQAEIAQMKARATSDESARLLRDLDELGRRLAEKEADLVAAEWTIGSLEKRLHVDRAPKASLS